MHISGTTDGRSACTHAYMRTLLRALRYKHVNMCAFMSPALCAPRLVAEFSSALHVNLVFLTSSETCVSSLHYIQITYEMKASRTHCANAHPVRMGPRHAHEREYITHI